MSSRETDHPSRHAEAIGRLRGFLASLHTDPPLPDRDMEQRLHAVMGMIPLFPDQFVYVVNYTSGRVIHAQGFERVLGYKDAEVDLPLIYHTWHPDDAPIMARLTEVAGRALTNTRPAARPFEVSLMVDYRVRKANGQYIKVLRHTSVFEVDEVTGRAISTFSMCKDISNIKSSNHIGWQFAGQSVDRMGLRDLSELRPHLQYRPTSREMDIIRLLAEGRSSKLIATDLAISLHTVNTHRRNLMERAGTHNVAELMRMAKEQGWV